MNRSMENQTQQRINLKLLFTLGFTNFVIGMGAFVVIGVLKPISTGLGMSLTEASQVLSVYALGYALSSPLLAALTGRWDRRKILLVGLSLFLVSTIAASLATTPASLLTARIFAALGASVFTPTAFSVAVITSPLKHRGRALSIVSAGLTLAQVAGVPIGTWLGFTFGWRMAFWCVSGLGVIALLLAWSNIPHRIKHTPITLKHLGNALTDQKMISAVLFTAFFLTGAYMLFTFMTLLLDVKLQLDRNGIALTMMVIGVGAFIGSLTGGFAADRLGPIKWLIIAATSQLILLPVLTLLDYGVATGTLLLFVWAIFVWSFLVPQQVRMVRIKPESQNVNLAINASCIYLGTAVGASIGGYVLEHFSLSMLGLFAAGSVFMALLLLMRSAYTRRSTRTPGPD